MFNTLSALDTAPISITSRALAQNFNLEEKERREEAEKNKDYYYGKQKEDLILTNEDVDPITMNLTKPIISKRTSMLYSRPLERTFVGPSGSIKFLEKVYEENSIDALLLKVDLLAELTGSCLIHPLHDDTFQTKTRLVVYDASQFSATGNDNDPSTADAISLLRVVDRVMDHNPGNFNAAVQVERIIEQQIWTKESVSYYSGSTTAPTQQSSFTHNLGYLPFVNFKGEEVHDQYIGFPQATAVVAMNKQINQMLTHLGYMIKMQAFTPIMVSGFENGEGVVWHPGRMLSVPAGGTAQALNLTPKLEETLSVLNWLEDRIYVCSSVPKISVEGGEGESGRELFIRWFPLLQVFREKTVRYARYELQLANLILSLNNLPLIEDVVVGWPEESILPFSPLEDELERDIRLNIASVVDAVIARNPGMSEEDAQLKLKQNAKLNKEINAEPTTTQPAQSRTGITAGAPDTSRAKPGQGRR